MRLEETTGRRAEAALELFSKGQSINFRGLELRLTPPDVLQCRVFSSRSPENVDGTIAEREFAAGRALLDELLEGSEAFAAIVATRPRTWELLFDYGQGAIRLCRLENDRLVWEKGFPEQC